MRLRCSPQSLIDASLGSSCLARVRPFSISCSWSYWESLPSMFGAYAERRPSDVGKNNSLKVALYTDCLCNPEFISVSGVLDVYYIDQTGFRDFELPTALCAL